MFATRNILNINLKTRKLLQLFKQFSGYNSNNKIVLTDEVRFALENNEPIVALESTIITHGMPFPDNVKCALEVESVVRGQHAIPATIAVIDGQIRVGLDNKDITRLADTKTSQPIKTSRRDLAYVVSNGHNGGTTVSSTLIVANKIGLPIFATGGIGGVHREGEKTFDISADLIELGKSNVAVISSGVKSILDIPKTLEYLETQGVFVSTFGTDCRDFPAFYSRKSGFYVPYSVKTPLEAAKIIHSAQLLELRSGMLFAVPVPENYALDKSVIDDVIEKALDEAGARGIAGKEITPFLLGKIAEITAGKSLITNIALVKNNAESAAQIAVALKKLKLAKTDKNVVLGNKEKALHNSPNKPVIIGGSNLDLSVTLKEDTIKMDGRIHIGKFSLSAGGVGRNISEALTKLDCSPNFITAIGNDSQGDILKKFISPKNSLVKIAKNRNTAQCNIIFNQGGDCLFLLGDMEIHKEITPDVIKSHEDIIKTAPLIVFDANLSIPAIGAVLELAETYGIPAFFEPTDVVISIKPFETKHWHAVKFITPNLNELKHITKHLNIAQAQDFTSSLEEIADLSRKLVENYIETVIVTLGAQGVLIARRGQATEAFLYSKSQDISVRHYPVEEIQNFVNVSGAGDSLASGIIAGFLDGLSEEKCISIGFAAARKALFSASPIADELFNKTHDSWHKSAQYNTLL